MKVVTSNELKVDELLEYDLQRQAVDEITSVVFGSARRFAHQLHAEYFQLTGITSLHVCPRMVCARVKESFLSHAELTIPSISLLSRASR